MKNGWETIDLEPLTLQFVPWDVNSNVHFYGDAIEYVVWCSSLHLSLKLQEYHHITRTPNRYDEKATLKRLLVPYGYTRMCKTFKYDRLPVPITELEGAESFDIVLRKQNGDIVRKTTYMTYGNTFADVLEQLERYVCVV